jgi:hypothetical protein
MMLKKLFSKKIDEPSLEETLALSVATTAMCSRIQAVTQRPGASLDTRRAANFNRGFVKTALGRAA